jgi:hypothetical protein
MFSNKAIELQYYGRGEVAVSSLKHPYPFTGHPKFMCHIPLGEAQLAAHGAEVVFGEIWVHSKKII